MTPQEELDLLYISIADGAEFTERIEKRINELDLICNPPRPLFIETKTEDGCGCGYPSSCWECAAIRGGCPEDV